MPILVPGSPGPLVLSPQIPGSLGPLNIASALVLFLQMYIPSVLTHFGYLSFLPLLHH